MATEDLTLRMRAQGARQAARDVDRTTGSVRGLEKQSRKSSRTMRALSVGFHGARTGALAFGAGIGVAGLAAKKSLDAASDLNEQISKTRVVFKASQGGILRWSQTTADSLGLSQTAALTAASGMGNLLVPMGVARDRAADMSKRMVTLAGDMASFNNVSPEETLAALQSAFIGEYDPVQRYGAALTAARVESKALSTTHKKSAKDLTAAEKAQAAYNLILKDTKDQQGDVARTASSYANAQRRLTAVWHDFMAAAGGPLLDVAARGLDRLVKPLQHVTNVARDVFSSSKLSWGEKFRALGRSIRHWFGPIANDMVQGLRDAHLDEKLKSLAAWASPKIAAGFKAVAPAAAKAFIEGFKAAPAWAQVLTAGFLLYKTRGIWGQFAGKACSAFTPSFMDCVGGKLGGKGGKGGGLLGRLLKLALPAGARLAGPVGALVGAAEVAQQTGANKTPPALQLPTGAGALGKWGSQRGTGGRGGMSSEFGAARDRTTHVTVDVDGKTVAKAVARHATKAKSTR